jgi:hypothetical protein
MKTFKYLFLYVIIVSCSSLSIKAIDSMITVFITAKKNTTPPQPQGTTLVSASLAQPTFITSPHQKKELECQNGIAGIAASYIGYFTISNKNGQIAFPRKHQSDEIYLLVTPEVEPVFMIKPSLIHHWQIKKDQPTAFYKIVRKVNKDSATKIYYFEVEKLDVAQDLPKTGEIPLNTITIYAHPESISIKTGIMLNTYSTNFVLPPLEALADQGSKNSLYTLLIKRYFEQINIETKNDKPTISSMIINK